MDFKEYQEKAFSTAVYSGRGSGNFVYPTLGLVGEAGEVAEKVKKILRDSDGIVTSERLELLKKEMGDVLWYLGALATELGLDLESIAKENISKLTLRKETGTIKGDGDTREALKRREQDPHQPEFWD